MCLLSVSSLAPTAPPPAISGISPPTPAASLRKLISVKFVSKYLCPWICRLNDVDCRCLFSRSRLMLQFPFCSGKCNIEYQKLGCFADKDLNNPTAALSEMMLEETNEIDWDKWSVWLPEFVCRCANLVYEKNYNVFGVHKYGMFLDSVPVRFRSSFISSHFPLISRIVH